MQNRTCYFLWFHKYSLNIYFCGFCCKVDLWNQIFIAVQRIKQQMWLKNHFQWIYVLNLKRFSLTKSVKIDAHKYHWQNIFSEYREKVINLVLLQVLLYPSILQKSFHRQHQSVFLSSFEWKMWWTGSRCLSCSLQVSYTVRPQSHYSCHLKQISYNPKSFQKQEDTKWQNLYN